MPRGSRITWCCWGLLAIAVAGGGCGSTGSGGSTQAGVTRTQTTSAGTTLTAQIAEDLAHFPQLPAKASARLPSPPATRTVERAFLTAVFDDAQSVWRREFAAAHVQYRPARLVIFWSQTRSRCGPHEGSGPFYCPADRGVYLDLRFFMLMLHGKQVGAAAQAFIIGHELAHHVQRLIGIADRVDAANQADPNGKKERSVRIELQADCLSGVWARSAYPRSGMTSSDLYDGLKTAHVIGDDYLALAAGNVVDRAQFTHGSSQDRRDWLRTGYRSGRPAACNTFARA